ncbi:MAG TPA: hypothetical protein VHN15_12860 [Thermoanaerobaculia bacterium]|nr:hypothetical protein [Thermoanaerobaculia bacterium]
MAEKSRPQNRQDELSADELDEVAGGQDTIIVNGSVGCGGDVNTAAGCGTTTPGAAAGTVS